MTRAPLAADPHRSTPREGDAPLGAPDGAADAQHVFGMELALEEARAALAEDEVPIGAVVVGPAPERRVLARAHNRTRAGCDATAHAELAAIREAARVSGYQRLVGCTLYTTLEPCFMCAGAAVHARLDEVVYGAVDPKFGGTVSLGRVLDTPGLNHRVRHRGGVLADEARALLQRFFREKRAPGAAGGAGG